MSGRFEERPLIGIPKGVTHSSTVAIFGAGGVTLDFSSRTSSIESQGFRFLLLSPKDIPQLVASGHLLCGVAGLDQVLEEGFVQSGRLAQAADLRSSKNIGETATWRLAILESRHESSFDEVCAAAKAEGRVCRIATELPRVSREWSARLGAHAEFIASRGSTEAYCPWLADGIIDVVHTGESLRRNGLRPLDMVVQSTLRVWSAPQCRSTGTEVIARIVTDGCKALGIPN